MTITLAAPATTGIKKQLTAWCRDNVAPDVLVRFEFNQTLLGGMVVRFGSHIYDWSLRRQILDGRTKFPEVLRNV
jgi:F0F1-type ATP synthase delta subunit